MIGERYWSTGITIWQEPSGGRWGATLSFFDDGFCQQASTEGELRLRYLVDDIAEGLRVLLADADRLGIQWNPVGAPWLYYRGDGEDPDYPPPSNTVGVMDDLCQRYGLTRAYAMTTTSR